MVNFFQGDIQFLSREEIHNALVVNYMAKFNLLCPNKITGAKQVHFG